KRSSRLVASCYRVLVLLEHARQPGMGRGVARVENHRTPELLFGFSQDSPCEQFLAARDVESGMCGRIAVLQPGFVGGLNLLRQLSERGLVVIALDPLQRHPRGTCP